jgi:hypothetical protein
MPHPSFKRWLKPERCRQNEHLKEDRALLLAEVTGVFLAPRAMPRRAQPWAHGRDLSRCLVLALCASTTLSPRTCDAWHPDSDGMPSPPRLPHVQASCYGLATFLRRFVSQRDARMFYGW